jgi:hypothetical protein
MRVRQFIFPGLLLLYFLALWYLGYQQPYTAFEDGWSRQVAYGVFQASRYYIPAVIVYLIFLRRRSTPFANFFLAMMVVVFASQLLLAAYFLLVDTSWLAQQAFYYLQGEAAPSWSSATVMGIKQAGLALLTIPLAYFLFGITKGKYNYQVNYVPLAFPDLPEAFHGFRFVQISDIHSGSFDSMEGVQKGIDLITAQQGDLLVFTGDLVNGRASEILPYAPRFRALQAPFGKYAVTGNHDYSSGGTGGDELAWRANVQAVQDNYGKCGFELLNNRAVILRKDGAEIHLIGVENWGKPPFPQFGDLARALQQVPADAFKILLSHDPSHWDEQVLPHAKHVHLTLSGHTHGMQFGLNFKYFKWSPIQFVYPRWAGLYEEARQFLYVNRGFGWLAFPGRIGMYPEITVFQLEKGSF